jgi:hypothetical protein
VEAPKKALLKSIDRENAAFLSIEVREERVQLIAGGLYQSRGLGVCEGESGAPSTILRGCDAGGARNRCADEVERGQFLRIAVRRPVFS